MGGRFLGRAFPSGGFGLGDEQEHQQGYKAADDGVNEEEGEVRACGDEPADGRAGHNGKIERHATHAEAAGAFLLGQDIHEDGFIRRSADIGEDAGDEADEHKNLEGICQTHKQGAEGTGEQAENDDLLAPEPVGQRAAREGTEKAGDRKDGEQEADLGHPNAETPGEVKGKERE